MHSYSISNMVLLPTLLLYLWSFFLISLVPQLRCKCGLQTWSLLKVFQSEQFLKLDLCHEMYCIWIENVLELQLLTTYLWNSKFEFYFQQKLLCEKCNKKTKWKQTCSDSFVRLGKALKGERGDTYRNEIRSVRTCSQEPALGISLETGCWLKSGVFNFSPQTPFTYNLFWQTSYRSVANL